MPRTPIYFFSHGGPNIMEDHDHPASIKLRELGHEITHTVRPKAVLVFSAHWQASSNSSTGAGVEVNTSADTPLIYDYYGFPPHYYEFQYPAVGDPELAENVLARLRGAGIEAKGVTRGLDHGVFAPFRVAFDPETNPLGVPIVQVSLYEAEDADMHLRLGKAVEGLRDEGVLIIVSGMAVHNLRELRGAMAKGEGFCMPYARTFDDALRDAVEIEVRGYEMLCGRHVAEMKQDPQDRWSAMIALLKLPDARHAHPTFEHLLPIHVGVGAAGNDPGKQLWTMPQWSMAWAQYRFGDVSVA